MSGVEKKVTGFTGRVGFLLALAGSAVGLGNLWRFPYLAAEYGGGAFIIVYVVLAVTFGFTLMLTEVCIGRRTGKSCLEVFGTVNKKWKWVGRLAVLVPIIVAPYYCVIGGWIIKFFLEYFTGNGSSVAEPFFYRFISGEVPGIFDSPVTWFLIFATLVGLVIFLGVEKGIERMNKILMPILLFLLVIITISALTMDGAIEGLNYYLVPNLGDFNAKTILAAVGQLFYSMSIAMGITITYGVYMGKDIDVEKSVRNVSAIDTVVALMAGLLIVPAVIAIGGSVDSGPGLIFVTLPYVFETMPGGDYIATLFFLLVIFAAATSAVALMEAVVYSIIDRTGWGRRTASCIVLVCIVGLGMLSCLGYGPLSGIEIIGYKFLDFFDFISNSIIMPIVAILTCIFIGFFMGTDFIADEVESSGPFRTKRLYAVMIKWVCPISLVLILVAGLLSFFGIMVI